MIKFSGVDSRQSLDLAFDASRLYSKRETLSSSVHKCSVACDQVRHRQISRIVLAETPYLGATDLHSSKLPRRSASPFADLGLSSKISTASAEFSCCFFELGGLNFLSVCRFGGFDLQSLFLCVVEYMDAETPYTEVVFFPVFCSPKIYKI